MILNSPCKMKLIFSHYEDTFLREILEECLFCYGHVQKIGGNRKGRQAAVLGVFEWKYTFWQNNEKLPKDTLMFFDFLIILYLTAK